MINIGFVILVNLGLHIGVSVDTLREHLSPPVSQILILRLEEGAEKAVWSKKSDNG